MQRVPVQVGSWIGAATIYWSLAYVVFWFGGEGRGKVQRYTKHTIKCCEKIGKFEEKVSSFSFRSTQIFDTHIFLKRNTQKKKEINKCSSYTPGGWGREPPTLEKLKSLYPVLENSNLGVREVNRPDVRKNFLFTTKISIGISFGLNFQFIFKIINFL